MASNDVRITESLRVKIGEAKNLPPNAVKSTYCTLNLDREEVYRSAVVEKSQNPFYGEEFHGEIPKEFRYLSCYLYEKPDKVLGKVSVRKRDLHKYHAKEHWFPLLPLDANSEVQGKVHLEIRFDEYLRTDPDSGLSHRLAVRVVECSDLPITNGACNPYAVVTLAHGKVKYREEVRRSNVKKKTICPQFEETFFFDLENKGQNHDRNNYYIEDIFSGDLRISLWHDDSRVAREVLGGMFPGVFLGEIKIPLRDLETHNTQNAWYFLRPRVDSRQPQSESGSIRLKITYNTEHVFSSHHYDDIRNLLLQSSETQCGEGLGLVSDFLVRKPPGWFTVGLWFYPGACLCLKPISSSAACILGHIVDNRQEAAQPLVRIFLHHGKIIPFIEALANYEIERTSDPNTLFRGNTLLTKMVDELMKLVGLPYLHHILKPSIDQICSEHLPCEIDPTKLREGENINANMETLKTYIEQIFTSITNSGLLCPMAMSQIFLALRQAAIKHFPDNNEVRYQVTSGFVFLRFFAPAILGPRFFDLASDPQNPTLHRTLTLISKAIQGLGNLVSSKSWSFSLKEEYMVPLFQQLSDAAHTDAIKSYLDVISSSIKSHSSQQNAQEVPVVLKEGLLIKRAQGRRKFGKKNFKQRYFCLTNEALMYSKYKGGIPLCVIPLEKILAVEQLQEQSFKMKYMFQVIQPTRALYVQANNCIEEKQWLDILNKVSAANQNRLQLYHPGAYLNGHWLCCKETDTGSEGCTPVSGHRTLTDIQVDIDSDREVEKIHALFLTNMEKLETMQEACGALAVYSGSKFSAPVEIDDTKSCFEMINEILRCVIGLEQEHLQYRKTVQKEIVKGSFETPIGDDSLVATDTDTRL